MEAKTLQALLNIALLQAVAFLFFYIKYYFNQAFGNSKTRLHDSELAISIFLGFIVFFVIVSQHIPLMLKYVFFLLSVAIHAGTCFLIARNSKGKRMLYPKSFLIFHNGSFLKGAILQNKLSEKEILKSLSTKGVVDLTEVDTIILEPDGELSIIYKKKGKVA